MSLTVKNLKNILGTYGMKEPAMSYVINDMKKSIYRSLSNGKRSMLFGVGCIKPKTLQARSFNNPKTGKPIKIKERITAKLKISKALKEILN